MAGATVQKRGCPRRQRTNSCARRLPRTPPRLEAGFSAELLDLVGARPAPIVFQHEIGENARPGDERADEKQRHGRCDDHLGARKDELAEQHERRRDDQQIGHPEGETANGVPGRVAGDRKRGRTAVEKQRRDLDVDLRKEGEDEPQKKPESQSCEQPAPRHACLLKAGCVPGHCSVRHSSNDRNQGFMAQRAHNANNGLRGEPGPPPNDVFMIVA